MTDRFSIPRELTLEGINGRTLLWYAWREPTTGTGHMYRPEGGQLIPCGRFLGYKENELRQRIGEAALSNYPSHVVWLNEEQK